MLGVLASRRVCRPRKRGRLCHPFGWGSDANGTAYVVPLTDGPDKPFDGEFRLIVNRRFGRSSEAYGPGTFPTMLR